MAKRTSRVAWGLAVVLMGALLMGWSFVRLGARPSPPDPSESESAFIAYQAWHDRWMANAMPGLLGLVMVGSVLLLALTEFTSTWRRGQNGADSAG